MSGFVWLNDSELGDYLAISGDADDFLITYPEYGGTSDIDDLTEDRGKHGASATYIPTGLLPNNFTTTLRAVPVGTQQLGAK